MCVQNRMALVAFRPRPNASFCNHCSRYRPSIGYRSHYFGSLIPACVAAYFSVTAMTRIFPGATIAIVVIAAMMEGGKLIGTALLSRNWLATNWFLRLILAALLTIPAIINAVGVFGQLLVAHLDPRVEAVAATDEQAAANQASIEVKQNMIAISTAALRRSTLQSRKTTNAHPLPRR
jgi:hypothetical protein